MTQSVVAYRETDSGNTSLSTGLRTHKGVMETTTLRVKGPALWPNDGAGSGQGLELAHYTDNYSVIQAYNREKSQWLGLVLNAGYITLAPQGGGKVNLPAGTVQALIGSYENTLNYTVPQINVWTETPVTCNMTLTGAPVRIDWNTTIGNPAAGAVVYVGVGIGGSPTWPSRALFHVPGANYLTTVSGTIYWQNPSPTGATRAAIFIYTGTANTSINPGAYSAIYVTEQRA